MHNQQQRYLKTNNIVSKFVVIVLSVVLLTGISLVPVLQIGVSAQQQQQPQPIIAIKITSPTTGQQVPTGELTISGTSTDNATSDCTVYADWNNTKPFQTAIATGPGGLDDYSTWTFTYTDDYHLITNGTNNLTSKLSCIDDSNGAGSANLTKSYSVNVIGALSDQNQQQQSVSTLGNTTTLDNVTAATTIAAREENESVRNVLPIPTVREEEQPSASTTDKNAEPVKSPLPSSPVTSTTSSESKNTTKNKEDTTIKTMNQIAIKTINQIAQRVASTNPDTNPVQVQQILVQLAKQTAQTASKEKAIEELRQIYSQVTIYPFGTVSQSLSNFAQHLASGDNVAYIIEQIIQEKARGKNISQSLVNIAVQLVCGGSGNINENVRQAAQIIANQSGVSVEKVESILVQIALQIFKTQGNVVTAQSICQIASHIAHNPNGIIAQTILQLVKQDTDDGGKSGETIQIIKKVVKSSEVNKGGGISSSSSSSSGKEKFSVFCILYAVNSDIDSRIYTIAITIARQTDVSVEATLIALSDFFIRVANDAGPSQALQSLRNLETDVAANPSVLNKIGAVAKLYEGGHDHTANQVSDFVADKLSASVDPVVALAEVQIPESASIPADGEKVVSPIKQGESVLSFLTTTTAGAPSITTTPITTTPTTTTTAGAPSITTTPITTTPTTTTTAGAPSITTTPPTPTTTTTAEEEDEGEEEADDISDSSDSSDSDSDSSDSSDSD